MTGLLCLEVYVGPEQNLFEYSLSHKSKVTSVIKSNIYISIIINRDFEINPFF